MSIDDEPGVIAGTEIRGRLVLETGVAIGRVRIEDDRIASVILDGEVETGFAVGFGRSDSRGGAGERLPFLSPGFVDIHVHGWGGHDAMGSTDALDGMARSLLRRGVTSFLPTAVTAPLEDLRAFADRVRAWIPTAAADGCRAARLQPRGPVPRARTEGRA